MKRSITTLYKILVARGMSFEDLASVCGLAPGTLRNIASGGNTTKRGRARVEATLGVAIWPREETATAAEGKAKPAA